MALTDKLTAIADAVRDKTGTTDAMSLTQIAEAIASIETGGGDSEPAVFGTFSQNIDHYKLTSQDTSTYIFKTNLGYAPKVFIIYPLNIYGNNSLSSYIFYWHYITNNVSRFVSNGNGASSGEYHYNSSNMAIATDGACDYLKGDIPIYTYRSDNGDAYFRAGVTYGWAAIGKAE